MLGSFFIYLLLFHSGFEKGKLLKVPLEYIFLMSPKCKEVEVCGKCNVISASGASVVFSMLSH